VKELVVLSGKGGTGKTSLVASFAVLARSKVLCDCDVDAANLHLVLRPTVRERQEFWCGRVAVIDGEKCTQCGLCQQLCRFGAIRDFRVDSRACEGCGFCFHTCPAEAITMKENLAGHWFVSETRYGMLVHARLGVAQQNSGKLVALIRQRAKQIAEENDLLYIISDGPPGIGCPVISSLSGADLALLVTEPTLSGIHDLERVLGVCRHFNVPAMVCINKYDINEENTRIIEHYCLSQGISVAGKIPFDSVFIKSIAQGIPVVESNSSDVVKQLESLWWRVIASLG